MWGKNEEFKRMTPIIPILQAVEMIEDIKNQRYVSVKFQVVLGKLQEHIRNAVIIRKPRVSYYCPVCDHRVVKHMMNCPHCEQGLDWY